MINVVSFFAPRPEHPYFQDYRPFLRLLNLSCRRFGHRHIVLTDDPFEVGDQCGDTYDVRLPRSLMKAVIAAQCAYLSDPQFSHTPTLLTGADCVLANDPAAAFDNYFDLGITVGNFTDCRMNTGAIFVREPCQVAEIWREALEHVGDDWGDDQTSLYRAILNRPTHGEWWARLKEFPVDPYNLAPEHPGDDCRRGVVLHFRGPRKRWMQNYCHHWLGIGEEFDAIALPNTEQAAILANMQAAVARDLPAVSPEDAHDGHAVLVGGGPSLASTLAEIRQRAQAGQTIFAMNGTAHYLARHGIQADYCVVLDARPENARFVTPTTAGTYLIASQCDASVFDALPMEKVKLWHCANGENLHVLGKGHHFVLGATSVGLTSMSLAYMMGYRKIHLYGYDSSHADGEAHAYEQAGTAAENKTFEVWCNGRKFVSGIAMYAQAQEFPLVCDLITQQGTNGTVITVHGDGLLPWRAKTISYATALEEGMAA